jgi:hypothetical protein
VLWLLTARDTRWKAASVMPNSGDRPDRPPASSAETTSHKVEGTDAMSEATQSELILPLSGDSAAGGRIVPAIEVGLQSPRPATRPLSTVRALAPFKRIHGPGPPTVDVEASVEATAEAHRLVVVTSPGRERGLDVAMVVDSSLVMSVCHGELAEFEALLRRAGAFRSVTRWTLVPDPSSHQAPGSRAAGPGRDVMIRDNAGVEHHTDRLLDPSGRRLVLLVTDAVADHWYRAGVWQAMRRWAQVMPTAVIDVLPEQYRAQTALGMPAAVMRSRRPAGPNAAADVQVAWWEADLHPEDDPVAAVPLPVVSLRPQALEVWAEAVTAAGTAWVDAVWAQRPPGPSPSEANANLTAEDRVQAFLARASRDAQALARILAMAPVLTLPLIRVLQAGLLPGTGSSELAEVLVGGLMERVPGQPDRNGPGRFRFRPAIRELLLRGRTATQEWDTHKVITEYLKQDARTGGDIHALLADPRGSAEVDVELEPFAALGHEVASRLGLRMGNGEASGQGSEEPETVPAESGHPREAEYDGDADRQFPQPSDSASPAAQASDVSHLVADALGEWLVGLLADAGRKKLTELVLGSEQARALQQAAIAAVQDTADELSPSDGQRAGQIAMVIREVFHVPVPDAPLAGPVMLLEGLQAGIAAQLAVLDDAELTGSGQSSADVLGVGGAVLADRLTGHLVREIIVRGSGGGPLAPLADQFNHELTHLQGQRIEETLARLADQVRDALARPDSIVTVAGQLLAEVTDPFALEVHRPVQPEDAPPGLPVLPSYMPREHDQVLGEVVRAAADGRSSIAVLVGGSATGKTRASWEALTLLRDQDPPWRLWHPIDPFRPDATLRELPTVGPRTVVWLNEAQFYLDAEGGLGERVAAALRRLLRDPTRAPVLVLATLWPQFWDTLTASSAGGADPHAQTRELLAGHDIPVPTAFTSAQMSQLALAADVRLVLAARSARDGEVIQFLAGAPELLARYRNAPPAAAALINVAMDARRLGMGAGLPQAFLEAAAPGYLTEAEWDALGEDWLELALAYTAVPCKGARGPLTRIRPAGSTARNRGDQPASMTAAAGPLYRLADYLDQHGRKHRASRIPPTEFWSAAAAHATVGDQNTLGWAAQSRGLYRTAAQLYKNASAHGDTFAASRLVDILISLRPTNQHPAGWAAVHAALDDPGAVARLLGSLREAGAHEQAAALLARDPAAHVSLNHPDGVAQLLDRLRKMDAHRQVAALLARDPAAHVSLDHPAAVAFLLNSLRKAGAHEEAAALAARAAARAPLDDPGAVAKLLGSLREAGAYEQAAALAARAAASAPLDDPGAVARLLGSLREADANTQAAALLARDPAAHVTLDDLGGAALLLRELQRMGAVEQAATLAARAALDDSETMAFLPDEPRGTGAQERAETPIGPLQGEATLAFSSTEEGHQERFQFGREADGSPAQPWDWEDLD